MTEPEASTRPDLSIVVPCYNSNESLIELVAALRSVCRDELQVDHEVVLVDDASPRRETWATIASLADDHAEVRGYQLTRNFGRHVALVCGYAQARGRWVVTMDDDLQHSPSDLPALYAKRAHDVVVGVFPRKQHSLVARFGSRLTNWLQSKLIGQPPGIYMSPYNLMRSEITSALVQVRPMRPYLPALVLHVTRDIEPVAITHHERRFGSAGYTLRRRLSQFSQLLINNSSLPLRLVALIGLFFSLFSFLYAVYLVIHRLQTETVPEGWTSLMVVTLMIGGLVLFSLGIVGEYLLRIVSGIEHRPTFVIRRNTDDGSDTELGP
ncbi:MAG: glycosyltransferase family 2 protein [Alphaproteobacteria bacterium]